VLPATSGVFPWTLFFIVLGSAITLVGVGSALATEVGKYALLMLFLQPKGLFPQKIRRYE
jgi:hypothetical protein